VGLANLGSESETCVGSRVHLVGVYISFEKNFYRLPFTPPSLVRRIGPSSRSFDAEGTRRDRKACVEAKRGAVAGHPSDGAMTRIPQVPLGGVYPSFM
jgi:hypothetical protein